MNTRYMNDSTDGSVMCVIKHKAGRPDSWKIWYVTAVPVNCEMRNKKVPTFWLWHDVCFQLAVMPLCHRRCWHALSARRLVQHCAVPCAL